MIEGGTQFIGIKPEINMQERKSNVANNPTDVFTIEDIANVSRPYKVYTALLTQSGGDDIQTIYSGPLTKGVTYIFDATYTPGVWDFSNIGGPVYPETYTFVATASEEPNSWDGIDGLVYNTGAPVVTVLENTIGNIWFTYGAVGYYNIVSADLFIQNKTLKLIGSVGEDPITPSYSFLRGNSGDTFYIQTIDQFFINSDNQLLNTPIEIRVYN